MIFRRGIRLYIIPSFKCNFDCSYCVLKIPNKQYPHCKDEKTFEEWKEFISTFPVKVREIRISGGEPFKNDVTVPLTNWAISKGYFVTIETNLTPWFFHRIFKLPDTKKIKLYVTYHKEQIRKALWLKGYKFLKRFRPKYTIIAYSFPKGKFWFTVDKDWAKPDTMRVSRFIIGPDFQIFRNCFEAYGAYKRLED